METKADWLRSEIKRLEGMKKEHEKHTDDKTWCGYCGNNQALTSIITRYKEELKVLENLTKE